MIGITQNTLFRNLTFKSSPFAPHSIYSINIGNKRYFLTYQNIKEFVLEFIKINSKVVEID